jgi:hypothetical protein
LTEGKYKKRKKMKIKCCFIDVNHQGSFKCKFTAYYGYKNGEIKYCFEHRLKGMTNLKCFKYKRCDQQDCNNYASFKYRLSSNTSSIISEKESLLHTELIRKGKSCFVKYCSKHKLEGMVPTHGVCKFGKCVKRASFGYLDGEREYCSMHKLFNMINLTRKTCIYKGCIISANFGYPDGARQYCSAHKQKDMINFCLSRKCEHEFEAQGYPCNEFALFGFYGERKRFCIDHKLDNMIDLQQTNSLFGIMPLYNELPIQNYTLIESNEKYHNEIDKYLTKLLDDNINDDALFNSLFGDV